jgi:antitoxin ParD1/3/4
MIIVIRKEVLMNVSITEELELFVQEQVASGMYHSNSEVIRDGLRLLKKFNAPTPDYKAWLNEQIDIGLAQIENSEVVSGEDAYNEMQEIMNSKTVEA